MRRVACLLLLTVACTTDPPADSRPLSTPNLLLEQARDGTHVVPRGRVVGVDLRSDLVLRFQLDANAPDLPSDLVTVLQEVRELGEQRSRSLAEFARGNPAD